MAPVILEIDFLQGNGLMLDFTQNPVAVSKRPPKVTSLTENSMAIAQVVPIYGATQKKFFQACNISVNQEPEIDIVDDCAVPNCKAPPKSELPACASPNLYCVMEKYHGLFCTKPGYTEDAWHYIPTVGNPLKVLPRRIPAHYRAKVSQQVQTMLDEGIIRHSKSPWMAPAVFVPKKSGQLRICILLQGDVPLEIYTPYRSLMKCRTSLQGQRFSQHLIFIVGTGSYLSILQTGKRLLSVQGLAWGFMSFAECHLDWQVPPVHSNA